MLEIPESLRRWSALATALAGIGIMIAVGWNTAVDLAIAFTRFDERDHLQDKRIEILENDSCYDWLQRESEIERIGPIQGALRRPQPRFCIEPR